MPRRKRRSIHPGNARRELGSFVGAGGVNQAFLASRRAADLLVQAGHFILDQVLQYDAAAAFHRLAQGFDDPHVDLALPSSGFRVLVLAGAVGEVDQFGGKLVARLEVLYPRLALDRQMVDKGALV